MARKPSARKKVSEQKQRERWCADEIKAMLEARSTAITNRIEEKSTAIAERNEREAPIFRLSGELLNEIYRLVVLSPSPITILFAGQEDQLRVATISSLLTGTFKRRYFRHDSMATLHPLLAMVCRKFYREVTSIYFAENQFQMDMVHPTPGSSWDNNFRLNMEPRHIQLIRNQLGNAASALKKVTLWQWEGVFRPYGHTRFTAAL